MAQDWAVQGIDFAARIANEGLFRAQIDYIGLKSLLSWRQVQHQNIIRFVEPQLIAPRRPDEFHAFQ